MSGTSCTTTNVVKIFFDWANDGETRFEIIYRVFSHEPVKAHEQVQEVKRVAIATIIIDSVSYFKTIDFKIVFGKTYGLDFQKYDGIRSFWLCLLDIFKFK